MAVTQMQNPFMLQAKFGNLGDRKFLVGASWWSKWCDYVNFTVDEHGLTFPKESFHDELLCNTSEQNDFDLSSQMQIETAEMDMEEQRQFDKVMRSSIF